MSLGIISSFTFCAFVFSLATAVRVLAIFLTSSGSTVNDTKSMIKKVIYIANKIYITCCKMFYFYKRQHMFSIIPCKIFIKGESQYLHDRDKSLNKFSRKPT